MTTRKQVRERLDELIRQSPDDNFTSIANLIGKNQSYIQQFIRKGSPRRLKEEDRHIIASHFGISERELGAPAPEQRGRPLRGFSEAAGEEIVFIPSYDFRASAGSGSLEDVDFPDNFIPCRLVWLKSMSASNPEDLSMIEVSGDSMEPTLSHGDQILVDAGSREVKQEGVYVLRHGDTVHVKRLSFAPNKNRLSVKSDNSVYDDWDTLDPEDIDVVGRVIWVGRHLR